MNKTSLKFRAHEGSISWSIDLRDIEAKTGQKVNKEQIHLIKEALRTKNYEKLTPNPRR